MALHAILAPVPDRSRFAMLVDQVRRLMPGGREIKMVHVCREENRVSHYLANYGRVHKRMIVWLGSGPKKVPDLCKAEALYV